MRKINTSGMPTYIKGFFTMLAGIIFIVFPEAVANVIGLLFAIILVVIGLSGAVDYVVSINNFKQAGYGKSAGAEIVLVYSVIILILGIIFLIKPEFVLQILTLCVGVFFIIDGVVKLRAATLIPHVKSFYWWVMLILSLAIFAAGIAILIDPFSGTKGVIVFSGLTFIASGVESIILSFKGFDVKR